MSALQENLHLSQKRRNDHSQNGLIVHWAKITACGDYAPHLQNVTHNVRTSHRPTDRREVLLFIRAKGFLPFPAL